MLPVKSICELTTVVRKGQQKLYGVEALEIGNSFWNTVTEFLVNKRNDLSIQQIADLLWNYAYLNRKDPYFFKQLENELFEKEDEIIQL